MSDSLLGTAYAFAAMCSFVPCLSIIMSSSFPSWIEVSPFLLIGSTHKLVVGSLRPDHTILFLKQTRHSCLSQTTLHTASVNAFIDISGVCTIPGNLCARLTSLGRQGTSISHVCVDFNWVPSGRLMVGFFCLSSCQKQLCQGGLNFPWLPNLQLPYLPQY